MEREQQVREVISNIEALIIQEPKGDNRNKVDAGAFGISTSPDACNVLAFKRAIEHCKQIGQATLIVPKGKYYFEGIDDEPHICLDGISDFIIDGQGAEFVFGKTNQYIRIINSTRCVVKNLILDWNWDKAPLSSLGIIEDVAEDGSYFECRFPAYTEIPEQIEIQIVGPFDALNTTPGVAGGLEFRPYKNEHITLSDDEKSNESMEQLVRELSNIILSMEKVSSNCMRFYSTNPEWTKRRIMKGQAYHFRHFEYDTTAVWMFDSSHISIENIRLYSCPGSGIVGNGNLQNIAVRGCKVIRRPGTDRMISTTADCLHVANSKGNFIVENCEFAHAGDDCINIHDNTSMGVKRIGASTLELQRIRKGRNLFDVGDTIELRNSDFSPMNYISKILKVQYNEEKSTCTLQMENSIPEGIDEQAIVFNNRFCTQNYIIRNNIFHSNRARGILIHGSNGLVENNRFYNIQGAAIQIESGAESRWSEGTGVSNVIFRGNWIERCDVNRWTMAVIYMGVYLPDGRTTYPVFDGIIFEDNTVVNCPRMAWYLSSCQNIWLKNNTIINPNHQPREGKIFGSSQEDLPIYGEKYSGAIMISKANQVYIEGNKCVDYLGHLDTSIYIENTATKVQLGDNPGFEQRE